MCEQVMRVDDNKGSGSAEIPGQKAVWSGLAIMQVIDCKAWPRRKKRCDFCLPY